MRAERWRHPTLMNNPQAKGEPLVREYTRSVHWSWRDRTVQGFRCSLTLLRIHTLNLSELFSSLLYVAHLGQCPSKPMMRFHTLRQQTHGATKKRDSLLEPHEFDVDLPESKTGLAVVGIELERVLEFFCGLHCASALEGDVAEIKIGGCERRVDPGFPFQRFDRLWKSFPPPVKVTEKKMQLRRVGCAFNGSLELFLRLARLAHHVISLPEGFVNERSIRMAFEKLGSSLERFLRFAAHSVGSDEQEQNLSTVGLLLPGQFKLSS